VKPVIDILMSYAFHAKADLGAVRDAIGPDALLLIDSGAYTANTTGRPIRLEDYAEYLHRWEGVYSAAMTLDVVGDRVATYENTLRLMHRGLPVVPIVTGQSTLDDLDVACDLAHYIALGGIVNQAPGVVTDRYRTMMAERARRNGSVVHFLGTGTPKIMHKARPYSCDTATACRTMAHGIAQLWTGHRMITMSLLSQVQIRQYRDLLTGWGLDVRRLTEGRAFERSYRANIVKAAMMSNVAQGMWIRHTTEPVDYPDDPSWRPGPRLCVAVVSNTDIESAMAVARDLRTGNIPPRFERQLPILEGVA
jgi:hypothetical protein